jgi:hypothetical protein
MNKESTESESLEVDYTYLIIGTDASSILKGSSASIVHSLFKHIGLFTTKHIKKLRLISKPLEPVLGRHRIDHINAVPIYSAAAGLFSRSPELGSIGIVLVPGLRSLFHKIYFLLNQFKPGFIHDDLWAYPHFHTFSKLRCPGFRSFLISHT